MKTEDTIKPQAVIAGVIPQSLQPQTQVTLASLALCPELGVCAKSCARRSVCFCSQSDGGASIGLLTLQLQSCDWGKMAARFVRLALKVDMGFVGIILSYTAVHPKTLWGRSALLWHLQTSHKKR